MRFFGAVLSCIVDYRAVLVRIVTSEDGWSRSEAVVSALGGHYMESHATKSHTHLHGRMVCVCGWRAGVRMPLARVRETNASA